ncbi:MAG TPA: hypothetical protein VF323_02620 [Candidatus Limnocylindrales bacterium]
MAIGPAPLLAALVGTFCTALFIFLRGSAGGRAVVLLLAAILGAWAGDAVGARLGIDLLRIGDFRPVTAVLVAWAGLGIVSVIAILGPSRRGTSERR